MLRFLIPAFLFISLADCQNQNPVPPLPVPVESGNPVQVFEQVRDSLRFFDEPRTLDNFVAKYTYLKYRFQDSPNAVVPQLLVDWRRNLPVTDALATAVDQGNFPPELREVAWYYLCQTALQHADLKAAFDYNKQLQANFPGGKLFQELGRAIQIAGDTQLRLDSLGQQSLRADERLWALGNIWAGYAEESGLFVTEASGYNYALARPYLEELTKKFPESPFADDAAFKLVDFSLSGAGEGGDAGYCFQAAQEYENVLARFPNSDLRAKILLEAAGLYQTYSAYNPDDPESVTPIIRSCQRGIAVAEQRLREFPNPPERAESEEMIARLHQKIAVFSLSLRIVANKTAYRGGEPILISFSLTNPGSQAIDIRLSYWKNCPNFGLVAYCDAENQPEGPREMYLEAASKNCRPNGARMRIEAGQTYRETWDVTRQIFESTNRFPAPGRYTLRGQLDLQDPEIRLIRSDNIRIQVGE